LMVSASALSSLSPVPTMSRAKTSMTKAT